MVSKDYLLYQLLIICLYPADSLGGDLYWAAGLSIISDVTKRPHWPVKLHSFVNLGRLDSRDKCTPPSLLSRTHSAHPLCSPKPC